MAAMVMVPVVLADLALPDADPDVVPDMAPVDA